jgi:hypothetical protein
MRLTSTGPASPKRKRSQNSITTTSIQPSSPIRLITGIPTPLLPEADLASESPRSKMTCRFEKLQLEGSGGAIGTSISHVELPSSSPSAEIVMGDRARSSKRCRVGDVIEIEEEIPETPQVHVRARNMNADVKADLDYKRKLAESPLRGGGGAMVFRGIENGRPKLARSHLAVSKFEDEESLAPLKNQSKLFAEIPIQQPERAQLEAPDEQALDCDRTALTWHEHEITGHDPSDPEDDGEGINGVGFKPTAAIARARAEKRRKQLAEYRTREAREERAKRSEKRRGGSPIRRDTKVEVTARRVRFLEAQKIKI